MSFAAYQGKGRYGTFFANSNKHTMLIKPINGALSNGSMNTMGVATTDDETQRREGDGRLSNGRVNY